MLSQLLTLTFRCLVAHQYWRVERSVPAHRLWATFLIFLSKSRAASTPQKMAALAASGSAWPPRGCGLGRGRAEIPQPPAAPRSPQPRPAPGPGPRGGSARSRAWSSGSPQRPPGAPGRGRGSGAVGVLCPPRCLSPYPARPRVPPVWSRGQGPARGVLRAGERHVATAERPDSSASKRS